MKPAVYLTALSRPKQFNWLTEVEDSPLVYTERSGREWKPQNYSREFHGTVTLLQSLTHSYNIPTARLALQVSLPEVVKTVRALGVSGRVDAYPSLALGAIELSPVQVNQMYQTLANGGFGTPLRAIRAVLDKDGQPLQRFPLQVEQRLDPRAVALLNYGLQQVVRAGTGRGLTKYLPVELNIAGKTGTTDDLRDSWFAGFSGDRLAVVWLGRDDDASMGLTGASGAMKVWGSMMKKVGARPLKWTAPDGVELVWIDPESGKLSAPSCKGAAQVPFIEGTAPTEQTTCAKMSEPVKWINRVLQ